MPTYLFQNEATGEIEEHDLPISECGQIGDTREVDGKKLRRIASYGAVMVEPNWAHTGYQFEPNAPGAPRYDAKRRVVFLNKREIKNFEAKRQDATEGETNERYDFGQFG